MKQRKYSISEIDAMRKATRQMFPFTYNASAAEVEDRLRTHMLNGTDPAELASYAEEYAKAEFEHFEENQRIVRSQRAALEAALARKPNA